MYKNSFLYSLGLFVGFLLISGGLAVLSYHLGAYLGAVLVYFGAVNNVFNMDIGAFLGIFFVVWSFILYSLSALILLAKKTDENPDTSDNF